MYNKAFLALLVSGSIVLSGCDDTPAREIAAGMVEHIDLAIDHHKAGEFDLYMEQMKLAKSAKSDTIGFEHAHVISDPDECNIDVIRSYYIKASGLLSPSVPNMSQVDREYAQSSNRYVSRNGYGQYVLGDPESIDLWMDCDRALPGFSDRMLAVEDYARESLDGWIAPFDKEEMSDEEVITKNREDSERRLNNTLRMWNYIEPNERNKFTNGDPSVEACISSFVGSNTSGMEAVNTYEIASLCRRGLY